MILSHFILIIIGEVMILNVLMACGFSINNDGKHRLLKLCSMLLIVNLLLFLVLALIILRAPQFNIYMP